MGALAEPECRRIISALELGKKLQMPVEWVAVSAGAKIDWESGTENLDWTARVLRHIIDFTQNGNEINIIVPGICVGAQAYWNAEATMMMHTKGLLIMTDQGTMVLTGKRALDFSGCVSAEDDLALGGYTAIMGPNGQAQVHASDIASAYRMLNQYYAATYVAPGARRPTQLDTNDSIVRDITLDPYPDNLMRDFKTIGDIFSPDVNETEETFRSPTDHASSCRPRYATIRTVVRYPRWETVVVGKPTSVVWDLCHRDRKPTTRPLGHTCCEWSRPTRRRNTLSPSIAQTRPRFEFGKWATSGRGTREFIGL